MAERLKRKWIGIDITFQSIALILKRLEDRYPDTLLNREDDVLKVVTVAEIIQGKRLDLPMARKDTMKSARAAEDDGRQASLL